jgi:hypothetical protein
MILEGPGSPFGKYAILSVRWTFLRLTSYAIAAVMTTAIFFAGAAFYSFVWPVRPSISLSPSSRPLNPNTVPAVAPLAPALPSESSGEPAPVATQEMPSRNVARDRKEVLGTDEALGGRDGPVGHANTEIPFKLSPDQRTKIATAIHQQNVKPLTNGNFSISVGARVPRDVDFRPLPAEIVTMYPAWRGYQFFLVRNQTIVVNPRTLEIVAVID